MHAGNIKAIFLSRWNNGHSFSCLMIFYNFELFATFATSVLVFLTACLNKIFYLSVWRQCGILYSSSINVSCRTMRNWRCLFRKEWITATLTSFAFLVNQVNVFTSDRLPRHLFCLSSFVIRHWCRLCSTVLLLLWGLLVDLRSQPVPNTTLLRSVNMKKRHCLNEVVL